MNQDLITLMQSENYAIERVEEHYKFKAIRTVLNNFTHLMTKAKKCSLLKVRSPGCAVQKNNTCDFIDKITRGSADPSAVFCLVLHMLQVFRSDILTPSKSY